MALTDLQKKILRLLAANRSEKSYLAGGLLLNLNWARRSDDIDTFTTATRKSRPQPRRTWMPFRRQVSRCTRMC
jgi:hypothetical protein